MLADYAIRSVNGVSASQVVVETRKTRDVNGNEVFVPIIGNGNSEDIPGARITISSEARARATGREKPSSEQTSRGLTEEQQDQISDLKGTDRKVRAHEQAHMASGGNLVTGGARYSYKTGPDGVRSAVGGEVSIDTSPVKDDPAATVRKAQRIQQAALAPADPSSQDRKVAAEAAQMANQAAFELARLRYQEATQGLRGVTSTFSLAA